MNVDAGGDGRAWLLFDGDCGFCTRSAAWVERRDRARRLRVTPYQQAPSPPMTPALFAACAEAVHAVTPEGRTLRGGDAAIHVAGALWGRPLAATLAVRPLRDAIALGYRLVAARTRKQGACAIEERPRTG